MKTVKTAKPIAKSNHSTRPQVVVNRFPENQDVFNRSKLVPGKLSYSSAVKSTRLNSGKQNRIIIFGDSILRRISVREFNNESKIGSREILHQVNPTLESDNYDSVVLHFGVNDLLQKALSKSDTVENQVENIRKVAAKCISHGVSEVFVSPIVRNKRIAESLVEEVNNYISILYFKVNSYISIFQILRKLRLKDPRNPLIGYLNINSLRNKIIDVQEMIRRLQLHYFVISETKLDTSFPSAQFHIGDYKIRTLRDRDKSGGGLIEFVEKGIINKFTETNLGETICTEITISKKRWFCMGVYRPPSSSNIDTFFVELTVFLSEAVNKFDNLIIMGDYCYRYRYG